MKSRVLMLVAVIFMAAPSWAAAEAWAVQTVALRDYREAQSAADDLRSRAFDAYTEFAMQDGLQFVRVRIGCFTDRSAAEAMAEAITGAIVREAAVVEFTSGATARACASRTVGFMKPAEWAPVNDAGTVPAFNVKVAGQDARVVHDGTRWRVIQGLGPIPLLTVEPTATFSEVVRGGKRFVVQDVGRTAIILCPGTLLTHVGDFAIVEQGELLVACEFMMETP